MKIVERFALLFLLAALLLMPFQSAHARGMAEGPIFGSNFTLKTGETLNEDVVVFGGSISIEKGATVNGAVVLFGGSLIMNGEVSKDVVVMGGAVKLGTDSHIHGNLVTIGAPVDRDAGAKVDGDVVNNPTRPVIPFGTNTPVVPHIVNTAMNPILNILGVIGQSFILALLAVLIAMFLPMHMQRVADGVVSQPFIAFGMGLLTLILFIVAIVALALFSVFIVTLLVTVPLIIILSVVFAAACVLGWLAIGMEVGIRTAKMFHTEWPLPLAAGLGVFALNFVAQSAAFIPCIGGLLASLVAFAGLGAVFMTRFGIRPASLTTLPGTVVIEPPAPAPQG